MFAAKKMWSVLALVLALGLVTGCDNDISPENDGVHSYNVDEIAPGLFGAMSTEMTMDEWFRQASGQTYGERFVLYKDKNLKTPFAGSDMINEETVIYCEASLNLIGQGKKIGEITGTVTLTDIPNPATTKVYISCFRWSQKWWIANRKIDISEAAGTIAPLNWSLPVYESFGFDLESTFEIIVLRGDLLRAYTVPVPIKKIISNANANVGDLGTVSIKGVTLSGTITVAHNGQPVPYVVIQADFPGWGMLGITDLDSPEPNAPWSITFGPNPNPDYVVEFRVIGYTGRNGDYIFQKLFFADDLGVAIVDNQSVSGIALDAAD